MNDDQESQRLNPYLSPQPADVVAGSPSTPVSLMQISGTGIRLYRRNFAAIAIVTIAVWGPIEFAESYFEYFVLQPDDIGTSFRMRAIVEGLLGIIAQASIISIGLRDLGGESISWHSAVRQGLAAWPRLIWSGILSQFGVVLGLMVFVIPGIYLAVKISLYQCVAVNEGRNGVACLNRSMTLTKGSFLGFLILGTITIVAFFLIAAGAQLPLIVFPAIDNWVTYAVSNLFVDLVTPVLTLVYVAAYWAKSQDENGDVPSWTPPPRTTKVVVSTSGHKTNWWEG